jgi:outer membrane protein insertion porin family
VVNAPFRLYWAYNPSLFRGYLEPPIAAHRDDFPNAATYLNALGAIGRPLPLFERHSTFRFSIGRTF